MTGSPSDFDHLGEERSHKLNIIGLISWTWYPESLKNLYGSYEYPNIESHNVYRDVSRIGKSAGSLYLITGRNKVPIQQIII